MRYKHVLWEDADFFAVMLGDTVVCSLCFKSVKRAGVFVTGSVRKRSFFSLFLQNSPHVLHTDNCVCLSVFLTPLSTHYMFNRRAVGSFILSFQQFFFFFL